ncbi:MAG: response regulator [Dissulfurispiraceae bacterium]
MIRILLADDHAIVRKGIKLMLAEVPDIVVADEASDGNEVLEKIEKNDFDVLVLDIAMPGKSGLEVLGELKARKPKPPVLVLSAYPEEQIAVRALKAGADGYLSKESAPDELITAIRRLAQGKKYISSSLAEKLALDLEEETTKPLHEKLSNREYQVMCLIASGRTVKEIGESLSLSIKTVSTYRIRIMEKTRLKNNAEIIHYAIQNKLI